jgi:hypothetical protein
MKVGGQGSLKILGIGFRLSHHGSNQSENYELNNKILNDKL